MAAIVDSITNLLSAFTPEQRLTALRLLIEEQVQEHNRPEVVVEHMNAAIAHSQKATPIMQAISKLPPEVALRLLKPLPEDFDPDDCLSDEEVEHIIAENKRRKAQ